MSLYNRPLTLRVVQARENQRGAALEALAATDDSVYKVALRNLEAEHGAHLL